MKSCAENSSASDNMNSSRATTGAMLWRRSSGGSWLRGRTAGAGEKKEMEKLDGEEALLEAASKAMCELTLLMIQNLQLQVLHFQIDSHSLFQNWPSGVT